MSDQQLYPASLASVAPRRNYLRYLILVALAGWALASYDVNLLVLALPDIARSLHISEAGLGILGFSVYAAQFCITIWAGYAMDRFGRRRIWMFCLTGTALFTGLTYFVENFWQLVLVRAIASGLAYAELAVSITIVNEQAPAKHRGLLYSIVQGGWPLGVFLASGAYLAFGRFGWRFVFLLGVLPIVAVILGRFFVRESERFEHVQNVRKAVREGDQEAVEALLQKQHVAVESEGGASIRELFAKPGPIRRQLFWLSIVWIFYGASYCPDEFLHRLLADKVQALQRLGCQRTASCLRRDRFLFLYSRRLVGGALGPARGDHRLRCAGRSAQSGFFTGRAEMAGRCCLLLSVQATNGTWSGAGYAYQGESFPTRIRGTAVGFLSAIQVIGFVIGSILWTILAGFGKPVLTWLVIATGVSLGMWTTLMLRKIPPGQELEAITE